MDFGGRYRFAAEREAVWRALNDAELLRSVIPGCQHMVWTSPTTLDLKVRVDLGLIHPVFHGELLLRNVRPAHSYTLEGRGKGMLGLAHAAADIALTAEPPGGTLLVFSAAGQADGGIMRLGRAFVGNSAQKIIDGFFEAIGQRMHVAVVALSSGDA
jgi:carbon monoxide dehydrogenase subunit G